ncbi:hypothetical protein JAAARDRAFT_200025 [Jaapia argillacea MUCL 33604]|uniref:Uncharacterized protein n=1 Tax=Jaapia argillacea MUCL 33604 TaxID=933084 RepID=A0A067PH60_9AGAM|nr:hypothetical protein JAAARDRAFT_200025 [Jaapia argillacea MUCL 33604]
MADISAEAERKRQEKDKLAERRKLEIEERRKEVEAKMRALAELENDYARDCDDIEPNPKARKTKKDEREESRLAMDALRKEVTKQKAVPAESEKPAKKGKTVPPSLPTTWKQNVCPLLAKSAAGSRSATPSSRSATPATSNPTVVQRRLPKPNHRRTNSHETIGGFNHNDLALDRKAAIMLPHKHRNMVEILSDTEDADLDSLSPAETEVPEKKHRTKTSVPEEDSKSVETLPSWVKDDVGNPIRLRTESRYSTSSTVSPSGRADNIPSLQIELNSPVSYDFGPNIPFPHS